MCTYFSNQNQDELTSFNEHNQLSALFVSFTSKPLLIMCSNMLSCMMRCCKIISSIHNAKYCWDSFNQNQVTKARLLLLSRMVVFLDSVIGYKLLDLPGLPPQYVSLDLHHDMPGECYYSWASSFHLRILWFDSCFCGHPSSTYHKEFFLKHS